MKQGKIEFWAECVAGRFGRKLDFGSNRQISALNVVL